MGAAARAVDLNPRPEESKYAERDYIEKFERFVKAKDLQAAFLVVPGDITNKAAPDEFRLASKQIVRIAAALQVPSDHILFVPGNHDVDWKVLSVDPGDRSNFRLRQRYQPFEQPECLFAEALNRAAINAITDADCFCIWQFPEAIAVGLNSAFHDGPNDAIHHGLIPAHALSKLGAELQKLEHTPTQIRIAVVHHHPVQYSDPISDEPDFSAMTNAESLLKLLEEHRFDILVHGHKHVPNFNVWQVSSYFQLPILGAGSFSYLLDSRWNGLVSNQFHVLEIHERDVNTGQLLGRLVNFTYLCGHGWRESHAGNGIEHEIYFGGFRSEADLKVALQDEIRTRFSKTSFIRVSDLFATNRDFRYVASKLMLRVLRSLAKDVGFAIHDDNLSKMLLLKE